MTGKKKKKKKKKVKNRYITYLSSCCYKKLLYRTFGLNNRHLFLTILGTGKFRIGGAGQCISWWELSLSLVLRQTSWWVFTSQRDFPHIFFLPGYQFHSGDSVLKLHLNLTTFHFLILLHWGLGLQHIHLRGRHLVQNNFLNTFWMDACEVPGYSILSLIL